MCKGLASVLLVLACFSSPALAESRSEPWSLGVLSFEQRSFDAKSLKEQLYLTFTTINARSPGTRYVVTGKVSREGQTLRVTLSDTRRVEPSPPPAPAVPDFSLALPEGVHQLTLELFHGGQNDRYRLDITTNQVKATPVGEGNFSRWRTRSDQDSTRAEDEDGDWAVATVAKITATSVGRSEDGPELPRYAFDGDDTSGADKQWCTADASAKGQSVTVTFTTPQALDRAEVAIDTHALGVELVTDGGTVRAVSEKKGLFVAQLEGKTRSVTVRITEVDETVKKPVCVSDVSLNRGRNRLLLLHGVPQRAVARLRPYFVAAGAASQSCQSDALARVAAFPVSYDDIGGTDATAQGKLKSAGAMAKLCSARGGLGRVNADSQPRFHALPGTVSVDAGAGYEWILVWRAGEWRIQQIVGTGPGRH